MNRDSKDLKLEAYGVRVKSGTQHPEVLILPCHCIVEVKHEPGGSSVW